MLAADANGAQHVKNAISNKYKCLFKYVLLLLVPALLLVGVGQQPALLVLCELLILLIRWFATSTANVFVGALALHWSNVIVGGDAVVVPVADTAFVVDIVAFVGVACVAISCAFSDDIGNIVMLDNGSFGIDGDGDVSTIAMAFTTVGHLPFE